MESGIILFIHSHGGRHGFLSRNTSYALETLRPELVKNLEFGIDTRFLENKFGFTLFLYKSNSLNQVLTLPLSVATGYTDQLINAGNVQNKGLEVVINALPIKTRQLTWDVSFNIGMNRNKILELHRLIKEAPLGLALMRPYPWQPKVKVLEIFPPISGKETRWVDSL